MSGRIDWSAFTADQLVVVAAGLTYVMAAAMAAERWQQAETVTDLSDGIVEAIADAKAREGAIDAEKATLGSTGA